MQPLAGDLGLTVDTSCDRDDSKCVKDVVKDYDGKGNILIWYAPPLERRRKSSTPANEAAGSTRR